MFLVFVSASVAASATLSFSEVKLALSLCRLFNFS